MRIVMTCLMISKLVAHCYDMFDDIKTGGSSSHYVGTRDARQHFTVHIV